MKILVIDDSLTIRKILSKELRAGGYEVVEAGDGASGLLAWEESEPDLVTLDVDMPGMDGFETCAQLREKESELGRTRVPVIFVTANDTIEDREKGFRVGASDFITKPMPQGEIRERIDDILRPDETAFAELCALVVDDSPTGLHVVSTALRQQGITVLEAADGREASRLAEERRDELDLVVTDYLMPELNGDELCRHLRTVLGLEDIPVVFLSAVAEKSYILEMFEAGGTDYILKPFVKEELLARLRVHLQMRNLNRALQGQVEELKRLNALKDEVLAVTSHDLRSPLTSIYGSAQVLLADESLSEDQREFLTYIEQGAEFLNDFITDLLDLGRLESEKESLDLIVLDPAPVVESSINTLKHMAGPKGVNLSFQNRFRKVAPRLNGERNSLLRIVNNLVSNAIKFTPKGGSVTVTLAPGENGGVEITVADTGMGIAEEEIPHLFEKYSRVSRKGTEGEKSTGLGLAIARELMDLHKGEIEVESELGSGTTFCLRFPPTGNAG